MSSAPGPEMLLPGPVTVSSSPRPDAPTHQRFSRGFVGLPRCAAPRIQSDSRSDDPRPQSPRSRCAGCTRSLLPARADRVLDPTGVTDYEQRRDDLPLEQDRHRPRNRTVVGRNGIHVGTGRAAHRRSLRHVLQRLGEQVHVLRAQREGFSQRAQCIGIATANSPAGPFTPVSRSPLVCQFNHHGAIDPRSFEAPNGRLYLDWKSDDNTDPGYPPTHLWAQELSKNGLAFEGARYVLISGSRQVWNGGLVEAPDMVYSGHTYWLFYSGSWFNTSGYTIGVAKCSGPVGPCKSFSTRPWLGSNSQGAGPGEESLFHNPQGWWIVYNPWSLYAHAYRSVEIAKVYFGPSGPYLAKFSA